MNSRIFPLALLAFASAGFAQVPASVPVADPAAKFQEGTLPNGLRYIIYPRASAKRDVSLHLVVRTGSLDEHDDERGFAHFVEHMAFSGTRNYPPSSIRILFQRMGLSIGAHLNATTGYDRTDYRFDLQQADPAKVDEALAVLRDFTDGLSFDFAEVLRESGVVVSELKTRESVAQRNGKLILAALFEGTRLPDRDVGGVTTQLEQATPEKLRAFYQRTYLPGRMTLVVVGPVNAAEITEKITAKFGPIPRPAQDLPPTELPEPAKASGAKPRIVLLPEFSGALTEFVSIQRRPPPTVEGRRQELWQRLAIDLLNARLRTRVGNESPGDYGTVGATDQSVGVGNFSRHLITVQTAPDSWTNGLELAEPELRRARTEGFTPAETKEIAATRLSTLHNRAASFPGVPSARIAALISEAVASGSLWVSPAEELAEATQALEGITAGQLTAALNEAFPVEATRLTISGPAATKATPDRALAALKKSEGRALRKRGEDKELVFRYQDFGKPGAIVKRDEIEDLGLTLVSFANDVRLNLRPSYLEPESFRLRIVFPDNLSFIPREGGGMAEIAGLFMTSANPNRHTSAELSRLTQKYDVVLQFSVTAGTPILQFSGPASSLKFAFQLLTAILSDLNLDDEHYRVALGRYAGRRLSFTRTPTSVAQREALYVFAGEDTRAVLQPPEVMARLREEVHGWLQTNILNGPLEIGLVGDFVTDEAVETAAATVGTLKKRRETEKLGSPIAGPKKAERREAISEAPSSTATAAVLWPISLPDTARNTAALTLATDVFRDRLHLILRESLGANYSTQARVYRDIIQRDFAYVEMLATFDPEHARDQTMGCIRVAGQLAERGVLKEEFERLREPARARAAVDLQDNNWWLVNVVAPAQRRPESIEAARGHEKLYDEITLEEVNAAAKVFRAELSTAVIVKSAPGKRK